MSKPILNPTTPRPDASGAVHLSREQIRLIGRELLRLTPSEWPDAELAAGHAWLATWMAIGDLRFLPVSRTWRAGEPFIQPEGWPPVGRMPIGEPAESGLADFEIVQQRACVCQACDRFNRSKQHCRMFGKRCEYASQRRSRRGECPLGRWPNPGNHHSDAATPDSH